VSKRKGKERKKRQVMGIIYIYTHTMCMTHGHSRENGLSFSLSFAIALTSDIIIIRLSHWVKSKKKYIPSNCCGSSFTSFDVSLLINIMHGCICMENCVKKAFLLYWSLPFNSFHASLLLLRHSLFYHQRHY